MPSIATRTGDEGTTSLLYGQRVPKDHPQIEAVGAFDELSAAIGVAKSHLAAGPRGKEVHALLTTVQRNLVALMGELACAESDRDRYALSRFEQLAPADLTRLDVALVELEARGLKFDGWATPGATTTSAHFEVARTVARRAERRLTSLPVLGRSVRPELRQFVNRLSDLLWLLARETE